MITAFSEQPALTEDEFLKREYGIRIQYDCQIVDLLRENAANLIIIVSPNPSFWYPVLKSKPDKTVIFFLVGNETYDPVVFNALNGLPSLAHVFIYNLPTKIRINQKVFALFGDLIDSMPIKRLSDFSACLRDFKTSFHLKMKFNACRLDYKHSRLPQGYSNAFVHGLIDLGVIPHDNNNSLVRNTKIRNTNIGLDKIKRVIFVGQKTNRRRKIVVAYFSQFEENIIISKATGFGGTTYDGDTSYTRLLFESWFNLIPPGFFNNSNHRYTESCIAGSIPLILSHNSIDHSENYNWTNSLGNLTGHSMGLIDRKLKTFSSKELREIQSDIREKDFAQIMGSVLIFKGLLKQFAF